MGTFPIASAKALSLGRRRIRLRLSRRCETGSRYATLVLMLGLLLVVAIFSGNLAPLREVSAAPPESFARRTCRTLLRAVIDPVILVSKGIDPILSGNDLRAFDEVRYREYYEFYSKDFRSIEAPPSSVEAFLARLDATFDRVGYRDWISGEHRLPNRSESRQFVSKIKTLLGKGKAVRATDLQALARLYYSISRHLPYHSVELMMNLPRTSKYAFIDYQVENLFLRMAFADVLKNFGIEVREAPPTLRRKIGRALSMSLIGTAKILSWTNAEVGLARLARSDAFWNAILEKGYEAALKERIAEVRSALSPRANVEVFIGIAGGLYSIYASIEFAGYLLADEEEKAGIHDGKVSEEIESIPTDSIRRDLVERWKALQMSQYEAEIDSTDLKMIRTYYDTLDVSLLRETYAEVLRNQDQNSDR